MYSYSSSINSCIQVLRWLDRGSKLYHELVPNAKSIVQIEHTWLKWGENLQKIVYAVTPRSASIKSIHWFKVDCVYYRYIYFIHSIMLPWPFLASILQKNAMCMRAKWSKQKLLRISKPSKCQLNRSRGYQRVKKLENLLELFWW